MYLSEAPKLESAEASDPTKCGDLREYFEYDQEYTDDVRICDEVKDLKVSNENEEYKSNFFSVIRWSQSTNQPWCM